MSKFFLMFLPAVVLAADGKPDLFQLIRNNDLPGIEQALKSGADLNGRDRRAATPLMHSAAFGSTEAMRLLVDAGADVNAKSAFDVTALIWAAGDPAKAALLIAKGADVNAKSKPGRTPLHVAASYDGASSVVRLLLDKGAKVNAVDGQGVTPLLLAAASGDTDSVRLLIERGADVNLAQQGGNTALMSAALMNNPVAAKLLLAKGAKVNAALTSGGMVRNGELAFKGSTALIWASPYGSRTLIQTLLDAGADVKLRDGRGMNALMFAVASDLQDLSVVKLLIERGSAVDVKDIYGATVLDWARRYGNPAVIREIEKAGAKPGAPFEPPQRAEAPPVDARAAVERGVRLLQKSNTEFFKNSGCAGCHHQNLTQVALGAARTGRAAVDEAASAEQVKAVKGQFAAFQEFMLQGITLPVVDIPVYGLLGFDAEKAAPDVVTDTMAHYIAMQQLRDGSWYVGGTSRPPMEDGSIQRTAMGMRMLQVYGLPGRKAEFESRIARAKAWLERSRPRTNDDRVWRLAGLRWARSNDAMVKAASDALVNSQRADGGWAQNAYLASDAHATGTVLWALRTAGTLQPADVPYKRGAEFLLKTQFPDGSWFVRSRSVKFQPYFESGFPYAHDQWISASATAWAVTALAPVM